MKATTCIWVAAALLAILASSAAASCPSGKIPCGDQCCIPGNQECQTTTTCNLPNHQPGQNCPANKVVTSFACVFTNGGRHLLQSSCPSGKIPCGDQCCIPGNQECQTTTTCNLPNFQEGQNCPANKVVTSYACVFTNGGRRLLQSSCPSGKIPCGDQCCIPGNQECQTTCNLPNFQQGQNCPTNKLVYSCVFTNGGR